MDLAYLPCAGLLGSTFHERNAMQHDYQVRVVQHSGRNAGDGRSPCFLPDPACQAFAIE